MSLPEPPGQGADGVRFSHAAIPVNLLLAQVPSEFRPQIDAHLHRVNMKRGQIVFRANEPSRSAYFLETAIIGLLARSTDNVLEVGVIGRDGIAGLALIPGVNLMPYDGIVQAEGTALRITGQGLKDLAMASPEWRQLLGRYAYSVLACGIQTTVCNNFHPVKERSARWLLTLHDLAGADTFALTHYLLAQMVGVRRATVTLAANALQRASLVHYHHGRLTVQNRRGLEAASCECYRLIREQQLRLLGY